MKRHLVLALTVFALALLALRQDVGSLASRLATARLEAGDVTGAEAAFHFAEKLGHDTAPWRYNLGVHLYRKGEFALSRKQFDAALAAAGPALLPAAHYNRGNALFRQALEVAEESRDEAAALLVQGLADYRRTLTLAPRATDARHNLNLASRQLERLVRDAAATSSPAKPEQDRLQQRDPGKTPADTQPVDSRKIAGAKPAASEATAARPPASERSAAGTQTRRPLTDAEAEQLLSDARRQELRLALPRDERALRQVAVPDKDW